MVVMVTLLAVIGRKESGSGKIHRKRVGKNGAKDSNGTAVSENENSSEKPADNTPETGEPKPESAGEPKPDESSPKGNDGANETPPA